MAADTFHRISGRYGLYAWSKIYFRRRSNETRFIKLIHPHIRKLYRMAYRWTRSREEAEDLVQDVLASLLEKSLDLEKVQNLGPWLIKVLYHRYVDLYRRRQSSPINDDVDWQEVEFENPVETETFTLLDLHRSLNRALMMLEPGWRDAILLHDVEGYTTIEVAEILDINVGTVKSRLHRAHKKLKKIIIEGTICESHPC
ncbi:RNA polymerase sigma factor [Microbulbifer epialgicus]|uniref:RNA polymerase sigma factor n=1 Tax=Microbulbifer epialgicus TaxID=393907 RepID=A0ABV4NZ93_9GAMM